VAAPKEAVMAKEDEKVVPADKPIDKEPEKAPEKEPELLLGKYKTPEELAEAHKSLEKKMGEQSDELGSLRKGYDNLLGQIESFQSKEAQAAEAATKEQPATDYEAQLAGIYDAFQKGEITVEDALRQSNEYTAKMTAENVLQQSQAALTEEFQKRDVEDARGKLHQKYPDMKETMESRKEEIDAIIAENPTFFDPFAAYMELKLRDSADLVKRAEEIAAKGTEEGPDKVIKEPGSMVDVKEDVKPLTVEERKAKMMATLDKLEQGGAT
jgi:hypothetical protein